VKLWIVPACTKDFLVVIDGFEFMHPDVVLVES